MPQAILLDALNLAYWSGRTLSLRVPLTLATHLLRASHPVVLYFDASAPYRLAHEVETYAALKAHASFCIELPKGVPADRELLKRARRQLACIVSRDRYGEYRQKYRRLIDDATRLFAGSVANDRLMIPGLKLDVPLAASADAAWRELLPQCFN